MSDYRWEAMDLAELDIDKKIDERAARKTKEQINMFLESIPQDRFVDRESMIEDMKPMGFTREQVLKRLTEFVDNGLVISIVNMMDGRRRLYRRKGVMG